MENEFTKAMADRTDRELVEIVTVEKENYEKEALKAALLEIQRRNINVKATANLENKITQDLKRLKLVQSLQVTGGTRFVHYFVDRLIALVIFGFVMTPIGFFIGNTLKRLLGVSLQDSIFISQLYPIFLLIAYVGYSALMEIKFQKTIGKFITKSRVVNLDGSRPNASTIMTRSLFRMIPFDAVSFLFMKSGFHDYLSKTTVIKDIQLIDNKEETEPQLKVQ